MSGFVLVIRRDLHLAFRQGFESLMVVAFFVIAVLLFPLGVGPEPNILARILPGVIWVAALLASMATSTCSTPTLAVPRLRRNA